MNACFAWVYRASIPAITVAEGTERLPALWNDRKAGNRDGNIKNWFRGEAGHGSAPDMLDIQVEAPNVLVQETPFLLKQVVPDCLVSDNLYRAFFQTNHPSLNPEAC